MAVSGTRIAQLIVLGAVLASVHRPMRARADELVLRGPIASLPLSVSVPRSDLSEAPVPDPARQSEMPADAASDGVVPGAVLPQPAMSLDELQQIAWQSNPTLVQARMAVREALGQQAQAGVYLNPEIGWSGEDIGMDRTSGQQGAFIAQEFITAHKRQLARSTAGHGVAVAQHALEAQHWRVTNSVRWGFYEVLIAEKMVRVNEDLVRVAKDAEDVTARSRELKEVTEADVLQAAIEAQRSEVSLYQARNRHRTAWFQLANVLGRPELSPVPLSGDVIQDLPVIKWDEGLARLLSLSPELAQAQAQLEQARCNLAWQCARGRANFTVQVGAKYDETVRDTLADVSLSMPLQLFDRNQGNIMSAQARLVAATREVERVQLDLRNRFVAAFEQYSNNLHQVNVFHATILDKAQKSLDLTAIGYREGEFSYLSLLTAQRTYFAVNLEYLASLQQLWAQAVALDGFLLTGGLDARK